MQLIPGHEARSVAPPRPKGPCSSASAPCHSPRARFLALSVPAADWEMVAMAACSAALTCSGSCTPDTSVGAAAGCGRGWICVSTAEMAHHGLVSRAWAFLNHRARMLQHAHERNTACASCRACGDTAAALAITSALGQTKGHATQQRHHALPAVQPHHGHVLHTGARQYRI